MSSFKDNFGKNEESDPLDYDDSAFYFFASAMLIIIITIYIIYLFKSLSSEKSIIEHTQSVCKCDTCQSKLRDEIEKSKTKLFSKKFMFKFGFLLFLAALLYLCVQRAESVDSIKSFDPFEILDIPHDATEKEIKKAFRKKSLETHPDKNPDDPFAASKFLQVTRAHNALTDELSRENYKKYGNPDGPGPMKIAIGLPYFLMKKDNQIASLLISFLFILVLIPAGFFFWYSSSYVYTDKGLRQENERMFAMGLNENLSFADCPKLIAWAADFEEIDIKSKQELEVLSNMNSGLLKNRGPTLNAKTGKIVKNYKPHMLLLAYMHRGELSPYYQEIVRDIVSKVPNIVELWIDICLQFHFTYRAKRSRKNMSFNAMKNIMKFSQYCTQGLWEGDHELLQLPFMTDDIIKTICKKMHKKAITIKGKIMHFYYV